jgi:RNA recognition motif-containing protein
MRDENSVRVTNLSDDTCRPDLQELFGVFGHIKRIYIAYDRETHKSRGSAFVNFASRDDAARAIEALEGFEYNNLILRVEWAPDKSRPVAPTPVAQPPGLPPPVAAPQPPAPAQAEQEFWALLTGNRS